MDGMGGAVMYTYTIPHETIRWFEWRIAEEQKLAEQAEAHLSVPHDAFGSHEYRIRALREIHLGAVEILERILAEVRDRYGA